MADIDQSRTEALNGHQKAYINSLTGSGVKILQIDGFGCESGDASTISTPDQDEADIYVSDAATMSDTAINSIGGFTVRPLKPRGTFNG